MTPRLRYSRIREVKAPVRANSGDAGIDFYMPTDLTIQELLEKQPEKIHNTFKIQYNFRDEHGSNQHFMPRSYENFITNETICTGITLHPGGRILIPSGIKVLIEPKNSMLTAANKSGITTKKGLIFGAQIVDSPYTGEVHISIINVGPSTVSFNAGDKLIQFIHVPIYDTIPEEISIEEYNLFGSCWGTRGDNGFGSSDKQ